MNKIIKILMSSMLIMAGNQALAMTGFNIKSSNAAPAAQEPATLAFGTARAQAAQKKAAADKAAKKSAAKTQTTQALQKEKRAMTTAVTTPAQAAQKAPGKPAAPALAAMTRARALQIFGLNPNATDEQINARWLELKDQNSASAKQAQQQFNLKGGAYLKTINDAWTVLKPKAK